MGGLAVRASSLLVGLLCACSGEGAAPPAAPAPEPTASPTAVWDVPLTDPALEEGRLVWRETCRACHGTGLAGAPRIGDRAAWAPRIAQGMDVLVEHALRGFQGRSGTEMPARGGNPSLSDEQVAKAVSFVTSMSR